MASISIKPNGYREIQFVAEDEKRRTIRLGKVSKRQAEAVKVKVEDLAAAKKTGHTPKGETLLWLANEAGDTLHGRLAAVGLCDRREAATLGAYIDSFTASRTDWKPSTREHWKRQRRYLVGFFGEHRLLRTVTEGDADAYRQYLLGGQELKWSTAGRSCGIARQLFKAAMRQRLVDVNPFADVKSRVGRNEARMFFVKRDVADRVLNACPDARWRLLFALARFGGLRIPSEAVNLRWSDFDWEHGRFTVTSPKTEHQGKPTRVVPLFSELRPFVMDAFARAEDGAVHVFTPRLGPATNLRTHLERIIKRASLEKWPKLWQNLRATRATELADEYPSHVAAAWLGHTEKVADMHYRSVTEDHFARAAAVPTKAMQKAMHQLRTSEDNEVQRETMLQRKTALARVSCGIGTETASNEEPVMGQRGLEPPTSPLSAACSSQLSY